MAETIKSKTELFSLGDDGGPCFFWTNPWSGKTEKIANLWWPTHPPEATADVEELFADLSLQTEADGENTYEVGKRDGYQDAVQDIDLGTGGDGEFYGSTIPGRGVDVPTMRDAIIARFKEQADLLDANETKISELTAALEDARARADRLAAEKYIAADDALIAAREQCAIEADDCTTEAERLHCWNIATACLHMMCDEDRALLSGGAKS